MKVAIYCRVSTRDKQDIETQVSLLQDYAARQKWDVCGLYKDVGESGSKDSRPEFDKLLADMRSGKFNAVLVYKLDRIGRSLPHLLNLFAEFENRGVEFVSMTQAINTKTPEGKMFLRMLMVLAEYERELTVSRIHDGLDRAKRQGKRLGRPKGSIDKAPRRRSGYWQRWAGKKPSPLKKRQKPPSELQNKQTGDCL